MRSMVTRLSARLVVTATVILAACTLAQAQVLYGTLTGNVTDPSGARIPGAKVQGLNVGTGLLREALTDDRGAYVFPDMQVGVYKVTVTSASFQTMVRDNVQVSANEVRRVDFTLQIAKTTELVEVSAAAVALQTDKGDVHREISSQEITELPYNGGQGRNFQSLLFLLPGAGQSQIVENNSDAGNPARAQTFFFNGQSSTGNSTKLDGAPILYPWLPINIAYVPPSDAIQYVNVVTNAFDAEQGAAGGAAVNIAIKSGTNDLHGGLFEYNQNNSWTALPYFQHRNANPPPKNVFNQYGLFIGGPVIIPKLVHGKNKLFWFFDWQGTRRNQYAATFNLTLPNAAWRQGDFSALNCPANGGAPTPDQCIYDPLTGNKDGTNRQPFPNNKIPPGRISQAAATLAATLPALTRPNQYFNNTDVTGIYYFHRNNYDTKINYNLGDKIEIWGRYSALPMDIYAPLQLGPIAGGDAFNGGNPGHAGGRVQTTAIGFTYIISSTLFLDGNVGYTRQHIGADGDKYNGNYGRDVLKIPGTNGDSPNYQGVPGFQIAGIANVGNTSTGSPFEFRDNQYTTAYNLSKVQHAHNLRFGFQYEHFALNHFQPQGGTFDTARGTFGFDGYLTDLCNAGAANGSCADFNTINNGAPYNSWAAFLLGVPSRMGKVTQFTNPNALRFSDWSWYARDQWQVTRSLTVSYGLRWEYYPIFSHDNFGAVRYDPSTVSVLIGCIGSIPCDTGAHASKKNFAPRFGLAKRFGERTVVRGGYGITIDPDNMRNQRNNFPAAVIQDFSPAFQGQFISNAGVNPTSGLGGSTLATGLPAPIYPDISSGVIKSACPDPTCKNPVGTPSTYLPSLGTGTFAKDLDRGYIQTWNLFVQHEFSSTLLGEVGYVGAHGVRLMMSFANINGSGPGAGNNGRYLAPYLTTDLSMYQPAGADKYEALQTRLQKRIGASLIMVAYTYSKAMNNMNGSNGGNVGNDNGDSTFIRVPPVDTSQNWGPAGFDRKHTFTFSEIYKLPFGKGHKFLNSSWPAQLFGGFEISSTIVRFSGVPFTVGSSAPSNAPGQAQTANQIKPHVAIYGFSDASLPYFDGSAFAAPASNTLGTTARNILRGPGIVNIDLRVARTFSFQKEGRMKFQLLADAFNAFNHPDFGQPGTTCCWTTNATTGTINYNNFGIINSTVRSARQLQVAGRLTF